MSLPGAVSYLCRDLPLQPSLDGVMLLIRRLYRGTIVLLLLTWAWMSFSPGPEQYVQATIFALIAMAGYSAGAVARSISRRTRPGEGRRTLNRVSAIVVSAPMVGVLGTVAGIINSFRGCAGSITSCDAAAAGRLSQALVPTALGIAVAVAAMWCESCLGSSVVNVKAGVLNEVVK